MSSSARMKLDALLLHQLPDVIECDHVPPSWKNWHSVPCSFRCAGGRESAPGKLGNNATRGGLFLSGEFPGRLEDIIIDINCGAHASDAIAWQRPCQPAPRLSRFISGFLLLSNCGVTGSKKDAKLIRRRDDSGRRDTALLSCARAQPQRLPGRLFRRGRRHSGATHGGRGNERLSLSSQRQYAL